MAPATNGAQTPPVAVQELPAEASANKRKRENGEPSAHETSSPADLSQAQNDILEVIQKYIA